MTVLVTLEISHPHHQKGYNAVIVVDSTIIQSVFIYSHILHQKTGIQDLRQ